MKKILIAITLILSTMLIGCGEERPSEEIIGIEEAKQEIVRWYGFDEDVTWLDIEPLKDDIYIFKCLVYEEVSQYDTRLFQYDFVVRIETEEGGNIDVDAEFIYHGGHRK